jgi:thiol-disulfide isomerase/thioredoxin
VTVSGDSLPAFAEGDDPAVGLPAPTLQGEDFRGQPVAVADDGRPKAIVFLAHWCPHCQREVPVIQDWLDAEGAPQDVDLYSVATSIDPAQPNYPPDAWLEREGWTVPVLVDDADDAAATAFGLTVFPYFVFVDADGNVVARASGELTIEQLTGYLSQTTA